MLSILEENNKIIEFEGIDASGKTTYIHKLKKYLEQYNKKVKIYDFPQYNTYIGNIIAKYLRGEFGDIDSIPVEVLSVLFAADRVTIQKELQNYLEQGYYILLNRYTYSNIFQIARTNKKMLKDIEHLEFDLLNIIKPNMVVYLTLSINEIEKRIMNREKREYQNNKKDIYENNKQLLIDADNLYKKIAAQKEWIVINEDGLNEEEVFNLIISKLNIL